MGLVTLILSKAMADQEKQGDGMWMGQWVGVVLQIYNTPLLNEVRNM